MSYVTQQRSKNGSVENSKFQRRVHFSTAKDDIYYLRDVVPSSMMGKREKESAWYSDKDLIDMRAGALGLARQLRITVDSDVPVFLNGNEARQLGNDSEQSLGLNLDYTNSVASEGNSSDTGRGLELLLFRGRKFKRLIAAHTIMECHRTNDLSIAIAIKFNNPNIKLMKEEASLKLGYVSTKCSQWARNVALLTGYLDFKDAYGNNEASLSISSISQLYQLPSGKKRKHAAAYSTGEIQKEIYNKRHVIDSKTLPNSPIVPIRRMCHDRLSASLSS